MEIEFDYDASAAREEACPFTLWLPAEAAEIEARRLDVELAEALMTDLPMLDIEDIAPAADKFLGQWL